MLLHPCLWPLANYTRKVGMNGPNGAVDKPRRAGKPQAFPCGVGLIRVVVRREAPSNRRMSIRRPVVAGAKRRFCESVLNALLG